MYEYNILICFLLLFVCNIKILVDICETYRFILSLRINNYITCDKENFNNQKRTQSN